MNNHVRRAIVAIISLFMLSTPLSAELRDNYELTVAVAVKASQGWDLYRDEKFAGAFNDGHYTDPDLRTRVKDFWSDGLIAKLDRDDNGHHETIFAIVKNELVYAGSIGAKGTFVNAARDYHRYLGLPSASFFRDIYRTKPVNKGAAATYHPNDRSAVTKDGKFFDGSRRDGDGRTRLNSAFGHVLRSSLERNGRTVLGTEPDVARLKRPRR